MIIGINRLVEELKELGFENVNVLTDSNGVNYAAISGFEIPAGSHTGRKIDLAIPAPPDYPRSVGASMHVKTQPCLFPMGNIPNVRNVIVSPLGGEWQYWSYQFRVPPTNSSHEIISQINEIFRKN